MKEIQAAITAGKSVLISGPTGSGREAYAHSIWRSLPEFFQGDRILFAGLVDTPEKADLLHRAAKDGIPSVAIIHAGGGDQPFQRLATMIEWSNPADPRVTLEDLKVLFPVHVHLGGHGLPRIENPAPVVTTFA